jgi:hypothetical protein
MPEPFYYEEKPICPPVAWLAKTALSHFDQASKDLHLYYESQPHNFQALGLLLKCEKMRSNFSGVIELLRQRSELYPKGSHNQLVNDVLLAGYCCRIKDFPHALDLLEVIGLWYFSG